MRLKTSLLWLVPALVAGTGLLVLLLKSAAPDTTQGTAYLQPSPAADQYDDAGEFSTTYGEAAADDPPFDVPNPIPIALLPGTSEDRLDAIAMLSDSTDPLAVLTLQSLLDDPEPLVREEAVESLGEIGDSDAVAALGYALSDSDVTVRLLAIEALLEIGNDEAYGALTWTLIEDDVRLQELVIQELAERDSVAAQMLLEQFHAQGVSQTD